MTPCAASVLPTMQRAAILASGTPVALETKGTVREARGFTSSTKTLSSWIANCTFMRPTTLSALRHGDGLAAQLVLQSRA